MPGIYVENGQSVCHTDDIQDIITTPPSWILRWGITLSFLILVLIIGLSAFIRYPDIVNASLIINSPNSPKPVVAKIQGKLVKLLVNENESVIAGQPLAYMESTANHLQVTDLLVDLKTFQKELQPNNYNSTDFLDKINSAQLGELQASYQTFYQEYLTYKSSVENGFYLKKRNYLTKDLSDLKKQELQLNAQKTIQQRDYDLADQQFRIYQKLVQQKAATTAELRDEESKYLAKKSQLVLTDASLVSANTNYITKQKEILELDNQIDQEKFKFIQALNSMVSQAEDWKSKYILTASQAGKLTFANILQENQVLNVNQEVFYINPGNDQFFGEMSIPQSSLGKIKEGQRVLVKLRSYPFEEFGMLKGSIKSISDVPYKDSVYMSRVDLKLRKTTDMKRYIHLKQGMTADAQIITQDLTLLQRISLSFIKLTNK
jgi:multidrug efflux pump subunit AcrA (membrane-fusion protein)